jgi:hypothetical protein
LLLSIAVAPPAHEIKDPTRIVIVLPNSMAVRAILHSPVLDQLARCQDIEATILTPFAGDAGTIAAAGGNHLSWANLARPTAGKTSLGYGGFSQAARRIAHRILQRLIGRQAGFGNLVYRFNEIHKFAGHDRKKQMPPERRTREALAGNYVEPSLGRPFPHSQALLSLLYRLYYTTWYSESYVELFLDELQPDLLVIYHLQFEAIRPYVSSARRRSLPILGIVGSWDQPTTKGPLCPGVSRYVVQSSHMRQELQEFHGVAKDLVEVIGWPQMDYYQRPGVLEPREKFLAGLGLDASQKLIVLGANSDRLGRHEPGIVSHLAQRVVQGYWSQPLSLIVRPHPLDSTWEERFGHLHHPPQVMVLPAELGRIDFLANLLHHAQAVLASSGSILLDAVALDTVGLGIAFDGTLEVDYHQSVARYYEMDHFAPVVASGGVRLVKNFAEMDQAIRDALEKPEEFVAGQERCRQEQLEPLDGQASSRLVRLILQQAGRQGATAVG